MPTVSRSVLIMIGSILVNYFGGVPNSAAHPDASVSF